MPRRHLVGELVRAEVAEPGEQVVTLVGVARPALAQQPLEFQLQGRDHVRREQLTQVFGAQQVGQQLAIEQQRLCPALGQRASPS